MILSKEINYEKIRILDTTLRDGAQTPNVNMTSYHKFAIAKALAHVGVDVIEIGFAGNEFEIEGMKMISRIGNRKYTKSDTVPIICCFTKTLDSEENKFDYIEKAYSCVANADPDKRMIHLFVGTSKELIDYRYKNQEQEVIKLINNNISYARSLVGKQGYIQFSPEDAMRADFDFLVEVVQTAINSGADIINITDTTGFATPDNYYNKVRELINRINTNKNVIFSAHVHNDSGNAIATTLKGVLAGIRQIEGTILQLGERAGNADWMTIVTNLSILQDYYKVDVNHIKTEQFLGLAKLVSELIEQPIPLTFPVTGRNAFTESFGIHVEGVLKNSKTYYVIPPSLVGQEASIIYEQTTGSDAILKFLIENGYGFVGKDYSYEQMLDLTKKVQMYYTENNGITDTEIKLLAEHYLKGKPFVRKILIDKVNVNISLNSSHIEIFLSVDGEQISGQGQGNGLFSAMINAIKDAFNMSDLGEIYYFEEKHNYQSDNALKIFDQILLNDEEKSIIYNLDNNKRNPLSKSYLEIMYKNIIYHGKGVSDNSILSTLEAMLNIFNSIYHIEFNREKALSSNKLI